MKFEVHTNDKMQLKEALSTKQDKTFALGELEKNRENIKKNCKYDLLYYVVYYIINNIKRGCKPFDETPNWANINSTNQGKFYEYLSNRTSRTKSNEWF